MLSDKIWITRKSRIYTEQRLLRNNSIAQTLIFYYSAGLVFLSIWNLQYPDSQIEVLLIIASIAVLIISVLLSSQNYLQRSFIIKNCYIKLDELYSKVLRAQENKETKQIELFESEYTSLMLNTENHSDYDYLCLRFNLRNDNQSKLPTLTNYDYYLYFWGKFWRIIVYIFYFISPIAIAFLWIFRNYVCFK